MTEHHCWTARASILLVFLAVGRGNADSAPTTAPAPFELERLSEEASQAVARVYDYDPTIPLEARVVEKVKKEGVTREKIVFRGVQGCLVPGYLEVPAEGARPEEGARPGAGPFPCVLLLHGWSGSKESWWQEGNYVSGGQVRRALHGAGLAVFALDAQCHGDRIAVNDFAPVNHYIDPEAAGDDRPPRKGYWTLPEIYVQTVRDYRRALDYLQSRPDIDAKRMGILGYSMGGTQAFLLTGVEPRIKAAVAVATPAEKSKWSLVAPQNLLAGIAERPFLAIMGRSDELCPLEHAQALQTLIPSPTKELMLFDAGHKLPPDYVAPAAAWLAKHL